MNRLRLLALILLVGAAPPGVAPTHESIVSSAQAFLKISCAADKASCRDTQDILDGYLAALKDADTCADKACPLADIRAIFERDRKLDERENKLPTGARALNADRPLLRLSLLVVGRAGAALTLADPKAKPPVSWNPEVEAPKMVELICVKHAELCAQARALLEDTADLRRDVSDCEKNPCPFNEQERMAIAAEQAIGDYQKISSKADTYTLPIFGLIRDSYAGIAKILALTSAAKLSEIEEGEKSLLARVAALEKNPGSADPAQINALNARGAELIGMYRDAAISSDRTLSLLSGEPKNGRLRERVNASAARLASARARLMALKAALGLGSTEKVGVALEAVQSNLAGAGAPRWGITIGGKKPPTPRPTAIDRRSIPTLPPANPTAPPIIDGKPGFLEILTNTRSKDPLKQADALRRMGLTATLGDPSGRAGLVHTQNGSDTCAVVAQQEVLMAHGLLPAGDAIKIEAQLATEARERGFFRNGTPDAYTADLLVDRGLLVTKQSGTTFKTLDSAARRGGMIIANVDARYLWDIKSTKVLGHAIVITGVEVGRLDGKTLGYYINDSGSTELGAGRFVPIEQFKKAWEAHTKSFAEVH
ncbi:MAG: hypothetical protein COV48_09510 [Elusimicrobia bacterium CG11_big_fil_rev_8_21_14_0_20_64_6]|nr:MAG: hypothetical protein COV48_09510 [Elusimicrobia bacterium CG11_big_fil_rev_8_21_14_0_20_64_6]